MAFHPPEPPLGAARVYAPPAPSSTELLVPRRLILIFARMAVWSGLAFGLPMGGLFGGLWCVLSGFHASYLIVSVAGMGLLFGIPFSACMLLFQSEIVVDVPQLDAASASTRIGHALRRVGYHLPEPAGALLVSRPAWRAGRASGPIRIGIVAGSTRIVGPRHYVAKVERALRDEAEGSGILQ